MIDISDGLIADLGHIATSSGVRIDLETSRDRGRASDQRGALERGAAVLGGGADWQRWALTGGDDHALAATFPPGLTCRRHGRSSAERRAKATG